MGREAHCCTRTITVKYSLPTMAMTMKERRRTRGRQRNSGGRCAHCAHVSNSPKVQLKVRRRHGPSLNLGTTQQQCHVRNGVRLAAS